MGDMADVYDGIRKDITDLVSGLSENDLKRAVPATPDWTVEDVVIHLGAVAACTISGDHPRGFFESFGSAEAVAELNEWTSRELSKRKGTPLDDVLAEWEKSSLTLTDMMRGRIPWPEALFFPDRVLVSDVAVHQHDIYGALDIEPRRDSPGVKIAASGYIAIVGLRLERDGSGCLRFDAEDRSWTVGGDEPDASVSATRFEFFRALSGRRSPEQVRGYEWEGDVDRFLPYFYPYGIRSEPLHE